MVQGSVLYCNKCGVWIHTGINESGVCYCPLCKDSYSLNSYIPQK